MPQIGALHAISAHFAVGSEFEPATVVLPTGTGKTETMLATLVYRRLPRTLVIVPSDALRKQISKKLSTAKTIHAATAKPRVAIITTGIKTLEQARQLTANANVIVTLPDTLQACVREASDHLFESCSDLIVDEAHHITANTWQQIRDRFTEKRILQFTATPFRRDEKRIDGKIIFNYKLGDAQKAGYYRSINLRTVEEYGEQEACDKSIARVALSALKRDINELQLDHLLMARTSSTDRADGVAAIYQDLTPELKPMVVYSGPGRKRLNDDALKSLAERQSRIVICVDMLGEGFDFPNLKIAALHDTHKSLAITLQFIGRFTRQGDRNKIGDATVVANIADQVAEDKINQLYAEGADWDKIIQRLSEDRIQKELNLQDIVYGLKREGNLHEQLSLWNLRPVLSAQLFKTRCQDWSPLKFKSVLPKKAENWYALDKDKNVLVAVACRSETVDWGEYQNVLNTIYDLLILHWNKQSGSLCLYASDYDFMRSEKLAEAVTDDKTTLVAGDQIFNILNNVELPLVKSLGSSRVGAISFTSYFGPNVTEGLGHIEKAEAELNNLACLGYENGERVLWGGTKRRGKIWQRKAGTIADWLDWTNGTWQKVISTDKPQSNVVKDFLRPVKLSGPYIAHPISAQWGEQAQLRFNDRQFVVFGELEVPLFKVDIDIAEVDSDKHIVVRISSDVRTSTYKLVISDKVTGGYFDEHISGPKLKFRASKNNTVDFDEYLKKDPLIIRYADGTYSYNCYHIPTNLNAGLFSKEHLEFWDWSGVQLNKESMHKEAEKDTIQYKTYQQLEAEYDIVFNDDGRGEAADLVCLKDIDAENILLVLVHCKNAHEGRVSQDIRNFYTICGQAQKSVATKHMGIPTMYFDLKRRHEIWMQQGYSRFLKGDIKGLSYFKEKARRAKVNFEMVLVQPGASIRTITDDALRLLATTELFVKKTSEAKLRVILSE